MSWTPCFGVTSLKFTKLPPMPRRRQWQPTPVLLPGESHGRRILVGCSPWGHEELDTTERLHFHFSLSYIEEGNGNPLQCSCLENPRDRGAWWAAVYGVAQSRTRLKRLSSSSHAWGQREPSVLFELWSSFLLFRVLFDSFILYGGDHMLWEHSGLPFMALSWGHLDGPQL